MPLRLTNNRDIHLAQEWIVQLHTWLLQHGMAGYDPFDIKAHPWIGCLQRHPFLRKGSTAACDLFPLLSRRLLRIQPALNPKTLALTALGHLRLHQVTGDAIHLENGIDTLAQLLPLAAPGHRGLCWGYPFPVRATGLDCPANTPVGVVSAIAGEAFLLAHEITRDTCHLYTAQEISTFFLNELPRIPGGNGAWCFAYTPLDRRRVHNANLLAAEHVARTADRTGDRDTLETLKPAVAFSLAAQREDGAWPYGVCSAEEPYEAGLMQLVDHHHTGFVLRALHGINTVMPSPELVEAIEKGYAFYRTLIRRDGMPVNAYGPWPVDIHACAEGILCNSVLADQKPGALITALLVMRWTHFNMRAPRDGAPRYRKYPFFTSRIAFPRWGVAWMYRALAEYLFATREQY